MSTKDGKVVPLSVHVLPPGYKDKLIKAREEGAAMIAVVAGFTQENKELSAALKDILTWSDTICATLGNRMDYAGVEEVKGDTSCENPNKVSCVVDALRRRMGYIFLNTNALAISHHMLSEEYGEIVTASKAFETVYESSGGNVPKEMSLVEVIDHLTTLSDPAKKVDSSVSGKVPLTKPGSILVGTEYVVNLLGRSEQSTFERPLPPRRLRQNRVENDGDEEDVVDSSPGPAAVIAYVNQPDLTD